MVSRDMFGDPSVQTGDTSDEEITEISGGDDGNGWSGGETINETPENKDRGQHFSNPDGDAVGDE